MVKIGGRAIKPGKPALVGVVADRDWEKADWNLADILEIRLDRVWGKGLRPEIEDSRSFIRDLKQKTKKPLILTIRRPEESESPAPEMLPDENRPLFFEALIPLVDAVDVEISSVIAGKVIRIARRAKKPVIGSYHNFRRLPPDNTIYEKLGRAKNLGADIFKVAALIENPKETIRLLLFCNLFSKSHLICAVGMGKGSALSRIAAPLFGSVLTYASLSVKTAPGQLDLKTLSADLRRFYS
ncbi:MAG: type I 3-dehydroquinate dehydratase [Candidatus Omnitrophota bacterium]|nr:type I 3-dehydroquinate dehydratase [Candidatus Omnitrophota bacterium]